VARLQSAAMANPTKALLLLAHMDTVPVGQVEVERGIRSSGNQRWIFVGAERLMTKGMLAANLAVFIELKRSMARLNRDVIFLATADEETSGDASIRMLIAKHWRSLLRLCDQRRRKRFLEEWKMEYIGVAGGRKGSL